MKEDADKVRTYLYFNIFSQFNTEKRELKEEN